MPHCQSNCDGRLIAIVSEYNINNSTAVYNIHTLYTRYTTTYYRTWCDFYIILYYYSVHCRVTGII